MRRFLTALTLLAVSATACSPERAVGPEPQLSQVVARCQQPGETCNDPLLIIDGKVSSYTLLDLEGVDVQDVTVYKGAAAVRMYGEAARHGAIVINTKQRR